MKLRFFYSLSLLFLSAYIGLAQNKGNKKAEKKEDNLLMSLHSIDASIIPLSIGYTYEQRLSNAFTLALRPYIGFAAFDPPYKENSPVLWNAGLNLDGRWYYNMKGRLYKKNPIALNAGSFVGIGARYVHLFSEEAAADYLILPSIYWGSRSHLGGNFYFEFDIGGGYYNRFNYNIPSYRVTSSYKTSDDFTFSIFLDLKFSYVFSLSKKEEKDDDEDDEQEEQGKDWIRFPSEEK